MRRELEITIQSEVTHTVRQARDIVFETRYCDYTGLLREITKTVRVMKWCSRKHIRI